MSKYNPKKIEHKWQRYWGDKKLFRADDSSNKPKYYQLETFPYPSAAGLHVGHPKGYIAEDVHARYVRMSGKEVLYTMGWDAFGLPTENYAIKVGKSPQEVAEANIKNFRRQVKMFGLSYDWDREINTSEPEYYKWTQWLFLQLYKAGMAYQKLSKVNWCLSCKTVLANEQVLHKTQNTKHKTQTNSKSQTQNLKNEESVGVCERCETPVIQKEMKQWFFKITDYADRLLTDLEGLDWPEETVKRQKDWIGKSEGAVINFEISKYRNIEISVFTTRPDTLFGTTYLVLSPEHGLIENLKFKIENWDEVSKYIEKAKIKTELQRKEEAGEKTGIELKGVKAINPATKEEIPIWVADYVLGGYGTGAIMAVPAHDERDFEFAKKFDLPIQKVVEGGEISREAYEGNGNLTNSGKFDGMDSEKAKWEITKEVGGERKTQYKLRDWSVSRQRYWGVPIPIIYCHKCWETLTSKSETLNKFKDQNFKFQTTNIDEIEYMVVPVPEKDLPVKLPKLEDYRPKGVPPLASSKKFLDAKCPNCKNTAKRDAETLDTFVDSSWYFLRYIDPHNKKEFASKEKLKHWMPVDLYIIGAEHAILHLLYARFISKFLHDQGYLSFKEPVLKLRHIGLILGADRQKMSKSRGNVVNPDDVVNEVGADASRLYWMFMGPLEDAQPWDIKGVAGLYRFLNRVWNFISKLEEPGKENREANKILSKYIKEIGDDIKNMKFNTGVSGLMKLLNELEDKWLTNKQYGTFLKLLAPFAPHIAEELWQEVLGNKKSIHLESWPEYDETLLAEETVRLVIQVNGRVRDTIEVKKGLSEEDIKKIILDRDNVKKYITGTIKKVIYLQDRIINLVV
ncbi:MAG: hypothetical protein A2651_04120 [Candidatus Yanofskybacteria bacterium RIFCSPHIGHO2_01_FULL_42_12]|uniref:Leucine--tRNA ligase n=1 Tax=Candidatus Yanofskybacteria bacterium RIFCSPLOWO2_01_FULL_42_49 TaxID=1802694 RepID=A0A1F8GC07_9BACT|nr:MAG: hypothetical protein A2651_04120 [Candidatus Yanofskybacteria bacterium RIFCSPHIGHO2_01_FULL_42_12]OGN22873.1 MAG: hypothetical protein A2918_01120 [Candidatus Yanofskybacteria bacterium RIFCSPLOWO2_01_FULL_42_49]